MRKGRCPYQLDQNTGSNRRRKKQRYRERERERGRAVENCPNETRRPQQQQQMARYRIYIYIYIYYIYVYNKSAAIERLSGFCTQRKIKREEREEKDSKRKMGGAFEQIHT